MVVVVSSSEQCGVTLGFYNSELQLCVMIGSLLVLPGYGHNLWEFIHKLLQGLPETADVQSTRLSLDTGGDTRKGRCIFSFPQSHGRKKD